MEEEEGGCLAIPRMITRRFVSSYDAPRAVEDELALNEAVGSLERRPTYEHCRESVGGGTGCSVHGLRVEGILPPSQLAASRQSVCSNQLDASACARGWAPRRFDTRC